MFKKLAECIYASLFILVVVIISAAHFQSCFISRSNSSNESLKLNIIKPSTDNPKHTTIIAAFKKVSIANNYSKSPQIYFVTHDNEINAASLGYARFLFWETMSDLPSWAIEGIVAHEMAHDQLLHSLKTQELADLVDFITDAFGLFGGADHETDKTLKKWTANLTLPKYSRNQEYEDDKQAVLYLNNVGYDKSNIVLADTLNIIMKMFGDSGGKYFDRHPSTSDRIRRLKNMSATPVPSQVYGSTD